MSWRNARPWVWVVVIGAVVVLDPASAIAQPSPTPDAIRQKATEVFDRPEFQPRDRGASNWLLQQLIDLFAWLGGLSASSPALFWLILCVCVVALLGTVTLIVLQVHKVFTTGESSRRGKTAAEERRKGLSVAFREKATRFAAAGDYTEAIRFLFLSLVYRFDERGRISLHKAYTNREYLELLGERLPARDALRIIVDTLDDHWYGQRSCLLPQYEICLGVYDRLVATT